jgi:hypothetical protein
MINSGLSIQTWSPRSIIGRGHSGLRSVVIAAITVLFATLFCATGMTFAQNDGTEGQRAFAKKNYPWYDAETDQVQRIDFRKRPEARSKNRENIPLKPATTPAAGPNWNWNFGSGWMDIFSILIWVMIGAIVAALVAVLIWAFLRMESNREQDDDEAPGRSMSESIKQLPFDLETTTGDFRQLAQAAYANGDYRKAMIYLFSHVLVSLDQKGLVRLRKGKTNRQYLRELRPHRPLANYYQHVMVPFEATFFGDHELTRHEFENCWNELDGFQSGVENSSQVANV